MIVVSNLEENMKFLIEEADIGVIVKTETFKIICIKDTLEQAIKFALRRLN